MTSPFAYMFIAVHHAVTYEQTTVTSEASEMLFYTYGWKDVCAVFFYFLICIVMHAIIQEYVLDVSLVRMCSKRCCWNISPLAKMWLLKWLLSLNSQKISRKLHLSKVKNSKFNESGQLLVFYLMSVLWSGDVIFRYALGADMQVISQLYWNL